MSPRLVNMGTMEKKTTQKCHHIASGWIKKGKTADDSAKLYCLLMNLSVPKTSLRRQFFGMETSSLAPDHDAQLTEVHRRWRPWPFPSFRSGWTAGAFPRIGGNNVAAMDMAGIASLYAPGHPPFDTLGQDVRPVARIRMP
jgi:hypothetical protein